MRLSNAAQRKLRELLEELRGRDPSVFLLTVPVGQEPVFNELLAHGFMCHTRDAETLAFGAAGLRWLAEHRTA
jgi:hypothetical protein